MTPRETKIIIATIITAIIFMGIIFTFFGMSDISLLAAILTGLAIGMFFENVIFIE